MSVRGGTSTELYPLVVDCGTARLGDACEKRINKSRQPFFIPQRAGKQIQTGCSSAFQPPGLKREALQEGTHVYFLFSLLESQIPIGSPVSDSRRKPFPLRRLTLFKSTRLFISELAESFTPTAICISPRAQTGSPA